MFTVKYMEMSKFEANGVMYQEMAESEWGAKRAMKFSCEMCHRTDCHRCCIRAAHDARMENLQLAREAAEIIARKKARRCDHV